MGPFLATLEAEMSARSQEVARAAEDLDTLYVGGGTPSALGPEGLRQLLRCLDRFGLLGGRELTVELNPEHVDQALIEALQSAGVNRVSLGVQSLRSAGLQQLGRAHRAHEALEALAAVVDAGFVVSADLIVGWPRQGVDSLRQELGSLVETGVGHVSTYALTVEAGTTWAAWVERGRVPPVDEERQTALLLETRRQAQEAGFEHYEISSYARKGAEAVHNRRYWTGGDTLGLGPSASGAWHRGREGSSALIRRANPRGLEAWRAWVGEGAPRPDEDRLGLEAARAEALWLSLRELGVRPRSWIPELFGAYDERDREAWERLCRAGWVLGELDDPSVDGGSDPTRGPRLSHTGWLWHDTIGENLLRPPD